MKKVRSPGFTLVEMAIVLVLIGLIAGLIMPAIFKSIERSKTSEGEETLEKLRDEIIGFAVVHSPHRLPNKSEFDNLSNNNDPWGNPIDYWVDSDLVYDLCDSNVKDTDLKVKDDDKGTQHNNIAFVIKSRGKNFQAQPASNPATGEVTSQTIVEFDKQGKTVDGKEYDDIIEYVSLAYLKSKVCSDVATSHQPGKPSMELTFNDPDNPGGSLKNGAEIKEVDGELVLSLDGKDDYLDITSRDSELNLDAPAAVCMWFKSNDNALGDRGILFSMTEGKVSDPAEPYFEIDTGNRTKAPDDYDQLAVVRDGVSDGNKTDRYYNTTNATKPEEDELWKAADNDGWWHHVCVSCDGDTTTGNGTVIYFDGLKLVTEVDDGDSGLFGDGINIGNMTIGARVTTDGLNEVYFNGTIDDFVIYDRDSDYVNAFHDGLDICEAREIYNTRANVGRDAVAYFPFNGDAKDESGEDQLGHGHDGVLHNGPVVTKDRFECNGTGGSAYEFDGSDDWIEANSVADKINSKVTISAWINLPSGHLNKAGRQVVTAFNDKDGGKQILFLVLDVNHPYHDNIDQGDIVLEYKDVLYPGGYVADGHWHHVAFVFKSTDHGTTATIYVDGEFNASCDNASASQTTIDDDDTFSIGRAPDGDYFYGKIDDVAIFDRVLTEDEIRNLYLGRRIDIKHVPWPIDADFQW